ncbi:UNVERIFIED_ORG: hypothetical protein DFO49_1524 [Herbaspirillum seropedicae]|jgi:hypothetical protein
MARPMNYLLAAAIVLLLPYGTLRKYSTLIRPHYPPISIALNPAGTCALTEYNFRGGERGYWADPYRWFLLASGDAFYTITDLRTGRIIRDSTTQIIPGLEANSLVAVAMGADVFYWSADGTKANFPGGRAEDYFHEWTDIKECAGERAESEYTNLTCDVDTASQLCMRLRDSL